MLPLQVAAAVTGLMTSFLARFCFCFDPDRYQFSSAFFFACNKDADITFGFNFYPTSQAQSKSYMDSYV